MRVGASNALAACLIAALGAPPVGAQGQGHQIGPPTTAFLELYVKEVRM